MLHRFCLSRFAMRPLLLAAVLTCALPAVALAAGPAAKSRGPLSPLLTELARPAVAQEAPPVQDELLGVATEEPGGLIRDGERVQVTARFAGGAIAALSHLRDAGAQVVSASREQQTVSLTVAPEDLPALASVAGVRAVWQARRPVAYAAGEGPCEGGSVVSEGLGQLRVGQAREAFGLRGRGITVGVLSDSYDAATEPVATDAQQDVASNDLPGLASSCSEQQLPVHVLQEFSPGPGEEAGDEGRAMLQIVHDLAPHAQLAFATAFESEDSFAANIERLARPVSAGGAGAEVIVDDVAWFEEPFFQDGPVAAAINKVTAEGVTYLSATGNDNLVDGGGRNIASWETSGFRDSGSCPATVLLLNGFNAKHCLDFDPSAESDDTFGITVDPDETLTINLQWAEPWYGVDTDLDAFLLSNAGAVLTKSVEGNDGPKGTQRPVEIVQWTNSAGTARTVQLAINNFSGSGSPRLKFILMQNGGGVSATEYSTSSGGDVVGPAVFGHAGAASAISVAAVPFNNSAKPERYSSRGPVTHIFAPVEGTTAAAELGSAETIAKPDVAATDCGATTFFAHLSAGVWRFCGTSAAAPHAAAVVALLRQAKPSLAFLGYRQALVETAAPVGAFGPEAVGGGLLDADAALGSLPAPLEGEDGPSSGVPPLASGAAGDSGSAAPATPVTAPSDPGASPAAAGPPNTKIRRHPRRIVRAQGAGIRVRFVFASDQAGSTFLCKVDRSRYRACGSSFRPRVGAGAHVLKVKARSASGLIDPTPAGFRFRVESG